MKKVILFVFLCCVSLLQAKSQVEYKDISKLVFFGVDFSEVKVYGANETAYEFKHAFDGINNLFLTEPKKYDVYKYFKKKEMDIDLTTVVKRIESLDLENLKIYDKGKLLTDEELAAHIKNFDTGNKSGYGAILVANLIDKSRKVATYDIVIFNIDTKEIIKTKRVTTQGKGFGLRNYWAKSVLNALKLATK